MNLITVNLRLIMVQALLLLLSSDAFSQNNNKENNLDELNVVSGESLNNSWLYYIDASNSLYDHLYKQSDELLERRREQISELQSPSEWSRKKVELRKTIKRIIGPFPEKTPLNSKIIRTLDKGTYTVDHIIFESQPGFYVTSSLFIPSNLEQPAPTILYLSGHAEEGYRVPIYQHIILNLVKKGFVVYAIDPVGQGERIQYYKPDLKKSEIGSAVDEHMHAGVQAYLTGSSLAKHITWDGIRAVDYLMTRTEVDSTRIGITGRSGGGTQTSYLAAVDERIAAAAPEGYTTNFKRLLQTIGPQDSEQNLYHGLKKGIDQADFLMAHAPMPALLIATKNDFFSIQGAKESAKEISKMYQALGKPGNFDIATDEANHSSTRKNREAMYAFFQEHFQQEGSAKDEEVNILTEDELRVTSTGQLSTSVGSETIFSINKKLAKNQIDRLEERRSKSESFDSEIIESAKNISGYIEPKSTFDPVFTGQIKREGYVIEKYFIAGEGDYIIPFLLSKPEQDNNQAIIYLHSSGKAKHADPNNTIEKLSQKGYTVLAPDLIGVGEMGPDELDNNSPSIQNYDRITFMASVLIGRSITGIRSGDIVRLTRWLQSNQEDVQISAVADGNLAPALLHAAAFEPHIEQVALLNSYSSFRSLAMTRLYNQNFYTSFIPGALANYDLPHLAGTLAPRKLLISNPLDGSGECTSTENFSFDLEIIKQAYKKENANKRLMVTPCNKKNYSGQRHLLISKWLKKERESE